MAKAKGEPMPDPNVFFQNWNIAHPEVDEGRCPRARRTAEPVRVHVDDESAWTCVELGSFG